MVRAVPPAIPALLVIPPGVRGKEHAIGLERRAQARVDSDFDPIRENEEFMEVLDAEA